MNIFCRINVKCILSKQEPIHLACIDVITLCLCSYKEACQSLHLLLHNQHPLLLWHQKLLLLLLLLMLEYFHLHIMLLLCCIQWSHKFQMLCFLDLFFFLPCCHQSSVLSYVILFCTSSFFFGHSKVSPPDLLFLFSFFVSSCIFLSLLANLNVHNWLWIIYTFRDQMSIPWRDNKLKVYCNSHQTISRVSIREKKHVWLKFSGQYVNY